MLVSRVQRTSRKGHHRLNLLMLRLLLESRKLWRRKLNEKTDSTRERCLQSDCLTSVSTRRETDSASITKRDSLDNKLDMLASIRS